MTTYFNTKDGVILSQTDGINTWYFQYDTNGSPLGFVLNGTQYFYITNQMGDVLAITDTNGSIVGNYEYDAWGKVLTADTDLAKQNPLRYRGYYYDNEKAITISSQDIMIQISAVSSMPIFLKLLKYPNQYQVV